MKRPFFLTALVCVIAVAAQPIAEGPAAAADKKKKSSAARKLTETEQAAVSSGVLTQQEALADCKRMAGQMQVRILENRSGGAVTQSSGVAQGLQQAITPIFGGTQHGADAAGDVSRDITKLKTMNQILISRNCAYYDLDAELKKEKTAPTPRLIRGKPTKSKKKP